MEPSAIGRQLRARRTAAGRTVASVATDAGLSVPYIANLENGRGNPTTAALTRLAEALDMKLVISLAPAEGGALAGEPAPAEVPASLVRLGRTARFRRAAAGIAAARGVDAGEFTVRLVGALAGIAQALGRDLTEADWWRLVDATVLIGVHSAGDEPVSL